MRTLLIMFITACSFVLLTGYSSASDDTLTANQSVMRTQLVSGSPWKNSNTTIEFSLDDEGHLSGVVTKGGGSKRRNISVGGPLTKISLGESYVKFRSKAGRSYGLSLSDDLLSLSGSVSHRSWSGRLTLRSGGEG